MASDRMVLHSEQRFLFEFRDFLQASSMSPLFEICLEPDTYDLIRQLIAQLVSRQAQNIGIIMHTAVFGGHAVMARGSSNTAKTC